MQLSVLSSWPQLLLRVFEQQGLNAEVLMHQAGIDGHLLSDPNARIPSLSVVRLWQVGRSQCAGDLPLKVAAQVNAGTFHALGFAMATSETGWDALQRLAQYYPVLTTSIHLELREQGDWVGLRLTSSELIKVLREQFTDHQMVDAMREMREAAALGLLNLSRSFFGLEFEAKRINLQRVLNDQYRAQYQTLARCELQDGCDFDEVWFERARLHRRLPSANPALAELNDRIVERYLAILKQDVSARVATEIIRHLPHGTPTQEQVAKSLTLSPRSLQRKLAEQNQTYRRLLSETRRELALEYILHDNIPVLEIGFRLGFTEPANFSRAFKQWTGQSPLAYRQERLNVSIN